MRSYVELELCPFEPSQSITLSEACKVMAGRGRGHLSLASARRWANPKRGCKLPGGLIVVLPAVRLTGGTLRTMPQWVEQFEAARVRLGTPQRPAPQPDLPTSRQLAARQKWAKEVLDKAGI